MTGRGAFSPRQPAAVDGEDVAVDIVRSRGGEEHRGAAALGTVMLAISFVMLLAINLLQTWGRRRLVAVGR